jgi:hypothetical protein
MTKRSSILGLGLACLLATTAASAADAPKPAAAADAAKPAAADAAKIDWDKMDARQKGKYMKTTVLPQMKKLFIAFDKKEFAKMTCQTCHGQKAQDVKFKMPSAELPKLPQPTDAAGFKALHEKKPEVVKFMGEQVKPTMAKLLGKTEWTPQTPDGFGCYACHGKQETAAAPAAPAPAAPPTPPATKPAAGSPPAGKGW